MGISLLVALKATALFTAFVYVRNSCRKWFSFLLLYTSLVSFLVSIASHDAVNLPLLMGKRSDGSFPLWSLIIFGPYLGFVRLYVFFKRLKSKEPAFNQVCDGVYVGAWPSSLDRLPPGDPAIIDCTCELPRHPLFNKNAYICIPTWDTRSPRASDIESAVRWACRKRSQKKPVFIHCAFGHGRSVSVTCAILVELGVAEDWKQAEKLIKEQRPRIRMKRLHRKTLDEWSKFRLSSVKKDSDVSDVIMQDTTKTS
ncbi:hypothetical protein H6P81_003502 [Aristolochia fimbriata]|uniref:Tyrosine specific protein phosphatases domain-containing protein n=1 Tax=Aristolochia fimbriata TaxID=158543 RepID=A0AAV7FEN4_ARIFI|nr:hypothetical protein H6P81_003502 [Aristolochia fimbriata]